jgi:hypothetical protein
LGVPLHYKALSTEHWNELITKIENKLQVWQGKLLSLGGRLVLLNSVLSAMPLYWLSLFKLPTLVRRKIDRIRRKFLWFGGNTVRKKMTLVAWSTVCKSKDQEGL